MHTCGYVQVSSICEIGLEVQRVPKTQAWNETTLRERNKTWFGEVLVCNKITKKAHGQIRVRMITYDSLDRPRNVMQGLMN